MVKTEYVYAQYSKYLIETFLSQVFPHVLVIGSQIDEDGYHLILEGKEEETSQAAVALGGPVGFMLIDFKEK